MNYGKVFGKKMKFEFLIFWFSSLLEENISSFSTNISSTYVLENNFGKGWDKEPDQSN
jgi:hypothetical protein